MDAKIERVIDKGMSFYSVTVKRQKQKGYAPKDKQNTLDERLAGKTMKGKLPNRKEPPFSLKEL